MKPLMSLLAVLALTLTAAPALAAEPEEFTFGLTTTVLDERLCQAPVASLTGSEKFTYLLSGDGGDTWTEVAEQGDGERSAVTVEAEPNAELLLKAGPLPEVDGVDWAQVRFRGTHAVKRDDDVFTSGQYQGRGTIRVYAETGATVEIEASLCPLATDEPEVEAPEEESGEGPEGETKPSTDEAVKEAKVKQKVVVSG